MRFAFYLVLIAAACLGMPRPAAAAPAYSQCTGTVDSLPYTIMTPGVWCLKADLAIADWQPYTAITIASDDVVLDCNGFAIERAGTGSQPEYPGISAYGHRQVTIRRCTVRGFNIGIQMADQNAYPPQWGFVAEDNVVDRGYYVGIFVRGEGSVVRRNRIANIVSKPGGQVMGIFSSGTVDSLDNTIENLTSGTDVIAIEASSSGDAVIRGNRIRDLQGSDWMYTEVIGIRVGSMVHTVIEDNEVVADGGGTTGIYCYYSYPGKTYVRGNIVTGFKDYGVLNCGGDYGGIARDNDVSP